MDADRHVVATLFGVSDFLHNRNKDCVTSGPCLWVKRASKTSDPVLVTDLDTSLTEIPDDSIVKPKQDICTPIPEDTTLPDPERFVELVRDVQPNACNVGCLGNKTKHYRRN